MQYELPYRKYGYELTCNPISCCVMHRNNAECPAAINIMSSLLITTLAGCNEC